MKKLIVLTFPLLLVTLLLSITHVIVSNMLSTNGVELDKLQTELVKYERENIILREKVLADSSLQNIASIAAEMGFVDSKSIINLTHKEPLTRR